MGLLDKDKCKIDASLLERIRQNDLSLTKLNLSGKNLTDADIITLCDALTNNAALTNLDLSHNQVGNAGAQALAKKNTLISLDLSRNQVGDIGTIALAKNTTLTTLAIYGNPINNMGAQALANNTTLTTLRQYDDQIGHAAQNSIANRILDNQARADKLISACKEGNLTKVTKYLKAKVRPYGEYVANKLGGGNTLLHLAVQYRNTALANLLLADGGKPLIHLAQKAGFVLDDSALSDAKPADEQIPSTMTSTDKCNIDASLLESIRQNDPKLTVYGFTGQSLTDTDVIALCEALADNTTLVMLDFYGSQVSDVGAQALAGNSTFIMLNLTGNRIGDAGAQALARNTTLTDLHVDWNQISDAGAQALAHNTTLTAFNFENNPIGTAANALLYKQLKQNQLQAGKLIDACRGNRLAEVNQLLQANVRPYGEYIASKLRNGDTLLHLAIQTRNPALLNLLLQHGAERIAYKENDDDQTYRALAEQIGFSLARSDVSSAKSTPSVVATAEEPSLISRIVSFFSSNEKPNGTPPAPEAKKTNADNRGSGTTSASTTVSMPSHTSAQAQWSSWAQGTSNNNTLPAFLNVLPSAEQEELKQLNPSERQALFTQLNRLQAEQAAFARGLESTLRVQQADARLRAEISAIKQNAKQAAYFDALLRLMDQSLLACWVVSSGKVQQTVDIKTRLFSVGSSVAAVLFPPAAPFLPFADMVVAGLKDIGDFRDKTHITAWVQLSSDIPTLSLALAVTLTQQRAEPINAQIAIDAHAQNILTKLKNKCSLLLEALRLGESYTKAKQLAVLDVYKLLGYMMTHKPDDEAQDKKIRQLVAHLTGQASSPVQTAQTSLTIVGASTSTAAPTAAQLAEMLAKHEALEARLARHEAEIKTLKQGQTEQHNRNQLIGGGSADGPQIQMQDDALQPEALPQGMAPGAMLAFAYQQTQNNATSIAVLAQRTNETKEEVDALYKRP